MKRALIVILWISVIVGGACLRFEQLAKRPFHADEATGARITAKRMESGGPAFDPKHYHGPLLADLAMPLCMLRGETCWQTMSKGTLRVLPAVAGSLLVLLPLWWRRRFGDAPMLLGAALLASSPLLVYYSRMYIHEMLLALFGMMALMALTRKSQWGMAGVFMGLMFATKESVAISVIAWSGAGLLIAWENRKDITREMWASAWRQYRMPAGVALLTAALSACAIYTDGFRHPQGAVDAVRTFFVYETVAGHGKSIAYYAHLLALPEKSAGVWWFGTPVLGLALLAYALTFRRDPAAARGRATIRFIAYGAVGHFLIYSLITYKTPWLACLPWAHVCLLGGCSLAGFSNQRPALRGLLALWVGACLLTQVVQARRASGRYATDERNPYAYVPTRGEMETLEPWLEQFRKVVPVGALEPVAVIGSDYWPLPWYLRAFERIGYWSDPPADLRQMPLVFALPDASESVMRELGTSHVALPRGLRAGVPVCLFVRNDLWQRWVESSPR